MANKIILFLALSLVWHIQGSDTQKEKLEKVANVTVTESTQKYTGADLPEGAIQEISRAELAECNDKVVYEMRFYKTFRIAGVYVHESFAAPDHNNEEFWKKFHRAAVRYVAHKYKPLFPDKSYSITFNKAKKNDGEEGLIPLLSFNEDEPSYEYSDKCVYTFNK